MSAVPYQDGRANPGGTVADRDDGRRWTLAIAELRSRAVKARRAALSRDALELIEQSLSLCDDLTRELAGTGVQRAEHRTALDEFRKKLDAEAGLWVHLFDEMPSACVETDRSGIILVANRAAARLLNISPRHLSSRLLMHFAEDREQFAQLLRDLSTNRGAPGCALALRPRERAPVAVEAMVIARDPSDTTSWLWFFSPAEHTRPARPDRHPHSPATKTASMLS